MGKTGLYAKAIREAGLWFSSTKARLVYVQTISNVFTNWPIYPAAIGVLLLFVTIVLMPKGIDLRFIVSNRAVIVKGEEG